MNDKFVFLESMDILGTIPQYQTLLFTFIVLWITWLVAKRIYSTRREYYDEDEVEKKLSEWTPEPLVPETDVNHPSLKPRVVSTMIGKRIVVDNVDCLNLGTHNYLNLSENAEIHEKAIAAIKKYGVGSCGPRGFYGTVDVHLELEERIAKFLNVEEAIVYSYGFNTIASAIPAYCKRKDLIFVDEDVHFAVQKGLDATRANVRYFKHNNVDDLENLLKEQAKKDAKNPKKAATVRRFLIVEGIYLNSGHLCPLPEMVALCRKYKLRIFVDESISFGTIGSTGRGITEHFGINIDEIDLVMGTLEWSVGSIGGFCAGSSYIVEHQRLSGLGYCFSASQPPLLTTAATKALDIMENSPQLFQKLKENCEKFDDGFKSSPHLVCTSFKHSPVKHLYLQKRLEDSEEQQLIQKISLECFENGLGVILPAYLNVERQMPRSSLRICISVSLNDEDIAFAVEVLNKCAEKVLGSVSL